MTSLATSSSRQGPLGFGLRGLGFAGLQSLIALLILAWNPPAEDDYLRAYEDKQQALRSAAGPRIIFVGGSNLAFGIDCRRIGTELERATVNMALHAGLGMDLELAEVLPELREDDVVVISLEHPAFNDFVAGPELWRLLRIYPEIATLINARQWRCLADLGLIYVADQLRKIRRRRRRPSPFYLRSSFDEYGDAVAHRQEATRPPLPWISLTGISGGKIAATIGRLNAFAAEAEAKGARVLYGYPAINRANYLRLRPLLAEIDAALRAELRFPVLDSPAEMAYPQEDFFDTAYHLNAAGIERRSAHLVQRLRAALR